MSTSNCREADAGSPAQTDRAHAGLLAGTRTRSIASSSTLHLTPDAIWKDAAAHRRNGANLVRGARGARKALPRLVTITMMDLLTRPGITPLVDGEMVKYIRQLWLVTEYFPPFARTRPRACAAQCWWKIFVQQSRKKVVSSVSDLVVDGDAILMKTGPSSMVRASSFLRRQISEDISRPEPTWTALRVRIFAARRLALTVAVSVARRASVQCGIPILGDHRASFCNIMTIGYFTLRADAGEVGMPDLEVRSGTSTHWFDCRADPVFGVQQVQTARSANTKDSATRCGSDRRDAAPFRKSTNRTTGPEQHFEPGHTWSRNTTGIVKTTSDWLQGS